MKKNKIYKLWSGVLPLMFLLLSFGANAQSFLIDFPAFSAAPTQNPRELTVAGAASELQVQLDVAAASSSGADVTIKLPTGVEYVTGSVTKISGTNSLTITENGGSANSPVFKIGPSSLAVGDRIIFTIKRVANCDARTVAIDGTIFTDKVTGTIAGATPSSATSPTYNVKYAVFSFSQPSPQSNAVLGTNYTRTFTISNGGNGCATQAYFLVNYPSNGITPIKFEVISQNGITLSTPITLNQTSASGTTYFYTIPSTALPGGDLCQAENIVIRETYKINICNATTTYNAGWGTDSSPANWCQTVTGSATVSMASGVPDFTVTNSAGLLNYTDNACAPHDFTYTVTNTGTGNSSAAALYNLRVTNQAMDNSPNSRYTLTNYRIGNTSVTPTYNNTSSNATQTFDFAAMGLTTDPDGPGVGLEDVDGDGFYDDLPKGNKLVITATLTIKDKRNTYCGTMDTNPLYFRGNLNVGYSTMCNSTVSFPKANTVGPLIVAPFIDSQYLTVNNFTQSAIEGGVPFKVDFLITADSPGSGNAFDMWPTSPSKRKWIHTFTLPTGVTLNGTGNVKIDGVAVTASLSGNTLTVERVGNARPGRVTIEFLYTCGVDGNINIPYTLDFIDDYTSSPQCLINNEALCYNFTMTAIGCGQCSTGGPSISLPTVRRDDDFYGYTDGTLTTRVAYTAVPANEQKQALYYDVVRIEGKMRQNGFANNLYYRLKIDKPTTAPIEDKLLPITAVVTVSRSGSILTTTTLTASNVSTTGSTTTTSSFEWNLTSCLPAGGLIDGDEVNVVAKYRVNTKNLPTTSFVKAPGTAYTFYNKDTSGNIVMCGELPLDLYLAKVSTGNSFENLGNQLNSCSEVNLVRFISYVTLGGLWPFNNEIRPFSYYDYIKLTVPDGIVFTRTSSVGSASPVPNTQINTHTPVILNNGNGTKTFIFNNNGTFVLNKGGYYNLIDVFGKPSCGVSSGASYKAEAQIRDVYYAESVPYGTVAPTPSLSTIYNSGTATKIYANQPSISITNVSGNIQAIKPTESFTVRLASTGTSSAPYVWLAIPNTTGVNVSQVIDLATNTVLTPISYSGGQWFKISASGLASGATKDYRIDFTYTSCTATTFPVWAGWDCADYPTDPSTYTCGKQIGNLTFNPQLSTIQLSKISEPASPVSVLCDPLDYTYRFISAGAGNTIQDKLSVKLPTGMSLVPNSVSVEYPLASGNWFPVSTSVSGNVMSLDLMTHPQFPTDGLPGTLTDGGNSNKRMMDIKFQLKTDCNYTSGSNLLLTINGKNTCQSGSTGNGTTISSSTLSLAGGNASFLASFPAISSGTTGTGNCGTIKINVIEKIVTSTQTSANGQTRIILPLDFDFATPLNLTNYSSNAVTLIGYGTDAVTGRKYADLSIPAGMTTGQQMEYSYEITPQSNVSCGVYFDAIDYVAREKIGSYPCASAPGGTCSDIFVQTGMKSTDIVVDRPTYEITKLSGSYSNGTYSGSISIKNLSTYYNSVNPLKVDFYCADNSGNPTGQLLGTVALAGPVNAGTTITENYSFSGSVCNVSGKIYAKISKSNNCTCTDSGSKILLCYKPFATGGTVLDTNHGITALGRAGANNDNWPMVRKGAWTVLESKTKGFVVNRVPTTAAISNAVEGMMVYDEEADCLKIYTSTDNGATFGWKCYNVQGCPDNN